MLPIMPDPNTPQGLEPLSPEYLAEIAARIKAATDDPWFLASATFDAHARTDIPALLAEVERLRAELAARPTGAEATASPVRPERPRWQAVADALNEIDVAGIDLDGTIAGHTAWSVVWDRDAGWMVSGPAAEAGESR